VGCPPLVDIAQSANLEKALVKSAEPLGIDRPILAELDGTFYSRHDRLQRPLQVGDGHADLVHVIIAERGGQLGAGDGHVRGELYGRRLVLQILHLFEKLVDPHRHGKGGLIQRVNLEAVFGDLLLVFLALVPFYVGGEVLIEEGIDIVHPIAPFLVQKVVPAHFTGDDFIALRIIKVGFQQLHVLLSLLILLLEKTLPVVLVPYPFGLALVAGHTRLNVSFGFCAKGFRLDEELSAPRRARFD